MGRRGVSVPRPPRKVLPQAMHSAAAWSAGRKTACPGGRRPPAAATPAAPARLWLRAAHAKPAAGPIPRPAPTRPPAGHSARRAACAPSRMATHRRQSSAWPRMAAQQRGPARDPVPTQHAGCALLPAAGSGAPEGPGALGPRGRREVVDRPPGSAMRRRTRRVGDGGGGARRPPSGPRGAPRVPRSGSRRPTHARRSPQFHGGQWSATSSRRPVVGGQQYAAALPSLQTPVPPQCTGHELSRASRGRRPPAS